MVSGASTDRQLDALFINSPLKNYDLAPRLNDFTLPVLGLGYIATADDMRAELCGERPYTLFERVDLERHRQFGPGVRGGLGDAPRDRPVVGNAENEALLARKNAAARRGRLRAVGAVGGLRHRDPGLCVTNAGAV